MFEFKMAGLCFDGGGPMYPKILQKVLFNSINNLRYTNAGLFQTCHIQIRVYR